MFCLYFTSHFHENYFKERYFLWKIIVDKKKGGRSAGTPWPRCSWKWVRHKNLSNPQIFSKNPNISQFKLLSSVEHIEAQEDSDVSLRRRRNGSREEEGGGGHGERPETAKVSSGNGPWSISKTKKDPFQFNFQMSFDGTGCFHWCVGRSAEECTLTRFLSSQLAHVVHVVTSPRVL